MLMKLFKSLFGLCFCLFAFDVSISNAALPKPVGEVVWVKGNLRAVMPNQEERNLQSKSVIYQADELKTDSSSTAQLVFIDGALLTLKSGTDFKINQYDYSAKKSVLKSLTELIEGGFRTITGLVAKNAPEKYEMNTPVATIGVRGTDYSALYQDGVLYIRRYAGKPCVRFREDKNGHISAAQAVGVANQAAQKLICLTKEKPCAIVRRDLLKGEKENQKVDRNEKEPWKKHKYRIDLLEESQCPAGMALQDKIDPANAPDFGTPGNPKTVDHFCIS